MQFALDTHEVERLRHMDFKPEFTNAEMLMAVYRTDPKVVARILPPPLKPARNALAFAFVARYPQTNFGVSYNEAALVVTARFHRTGGGYCLSMPVDDDTALIAGRETLGFPKKMAETIDLDTRGGTIVGRAVRKGTEILRIELEPEGATDLGDLAVLAPAHVEPDGRSALRLTSFLFKFFPGPDYSGFDYLPRLISQTTVFRPRPGLRRGAGRVVVTSSAMDPLGEIPVLGAPLACVHGYWDNTMLPGQVIGRAWNPLRFLPYAFFKNDMALAALKSTEEKAQAPRVA